MKIKVINLEFVVSNLLCLTLEFHFSKTKQTPFCLFVIKQVWVTINLVPFHKAMVYLNVVPGSER